MKLVYKDKQIHDIYCVYITRCQHCSTIIFWFGVQMKNIGKSTSYLQFKLKECLKEHPLTITYTFKHLSVTHFLCIKLRKYFVHLSYMQCPVDAKMNINW